MRLAALLSALLLLAAPASAQAPSEHRIATGGTAGTYFPIGALIASAISAPPGSRPCAEGGACGVPGLTATAISTLGSVANVEAIMDGTFGSGFVQADIATWAATGTGIWTGRPAETDLVAIANLYPESIHIVARADLDLSGVADLAGKRVSLDERGSGTLVEARFVLRAAGLREALVDARYLSAEAAAEALADGGLDAFFFAGGYPARVVTELAERVPVTLVPVDGAVAQTVLDRHEFFAPDVIPAGTYPGQAEDVETVGVTAQWVTRRDQPEALVHAMTAALWNETTRRLLDGGHPKGAQVRLETALDGVGIDLHPGAERFYAEAGLLD
jgi:TRAP transporter TAXI family solute receptor